MLPGFPQVGQTVRSPRGWGYELRDQLGTGHFGAVFECLGPFDQPFALKVLMPANRPYAEVRREWLEEARRLWQLRHPNIVYVHDYFELDGLFYLVLERCDHSLEDMLGSPLHDRLVIQLSRQLLFAMQYLNDHDIVHNDIHAGNILIVDGGREPVTKFSDFGIAQDLYGRAGVRPPIVNNRIMAPEVALGGYSTAQSDLYQLGLLMFGMYTGQAPLDWDAGYDEVIAQIRAGVPRHRAEMLGTALGSVISVMLRRHEQYRFNTPAQVWEELSKLSAWRETTPAEALLEASTGPLSRRADLEAPCSGDTQTLRAVRIAGLGGGASSQQAASTPQPEPSAEAPVSARGPGQTWRPPAALEAAPLTPRDPGLAGPATPRSPPLGSALDRESAPESGPEPAPPTPRI